MEVTIIFFETKIFLRAVPLSRHSFAIVFVNQSNFNPNKAWLFEGSFFWGGSIYKIVKQSIESMLKVKKC